jgi:hypothetical protein
MIIGKCASSTTATNIQTSSRHSAVAYVKQMCMLTAAEGIGTNMERTRTPVHAIQLSLAALKMIFGILEPTSSACKCSCQV